MKQKLSKDFEVKNKYIKVTKSSDHELKEHIHKVAKYFVKEFKYDTTYDYKYYTNDENIGYLFIDGEIVFGGCGFEKLPIASEDIWSLEWVWLHPDFRHQGYFTYYWNIIMQKYSQLAIKAPISNEMQEFLKKQKDIEIQGSLDKDSGHVFVRNNENKEIKDNEA